MPSATASQTSLFYNQNTHLANHDERDTLIRAYPICISCTHWMLMGSVYTLSIRFAASPRSAPLPSLTIFCRSKRARSQSQHIQPGSAQTTSTPVGPISPSPLLESGEADRRDCAGHRVTLKKRYGLLLTQNSEWALVHTEGRDADWKQRMRRSWGYRACRTCMV